MTAYILGAATLILLALIVWRRSSPEFRRRSERPKFQFLANLGLGAPPPSDTEPQPLDKQPSGMKENDDNYKP
jgi:hypothetical protein